MNSKIIYTLLFSFISFFGFSQVTEETQTEAPIHITATSLGYEKPPSYPTKAYQTRQNGRYGFYDSRYVYVPFIYDELPKEYSDFMIAKKDGKYGVIDRKGELVIPFDYDKIREIYWNYKEKIKSENVMVTKGKMQGILNRKGEVLISVKYPKLHRIKDDIYYVGTTDNKYGLVKENGDPITEVVYEEPLKFMKEGVYITKKEGKGGAINLQGEVVMPFEHEKFFKSRKGNYLIVGNDNKQGLMTLDQKLVIPVDYEYVDPQSTGHIIVSNGEKKAVLDSTYKEIIPFEFDRIELRTKRYFEVHSDYGRGVRDLTGKEILPCEYRNVKYGIDSLLYPKNQGGFYAIYDGSKQIVPHDYFILVGIRGFLVASKGRQDAKALLDLRGNVLTDFIYERIFTQRDRNNRDKYIIHAERDGMKGTLSETGEEIDFGKKKPVVSAYQKKADAIHEAIKGEWYSLVDLNGKSFLQKLSFLDQETGNRMVYNLEEGKECSVEQYFKPIMIDVNGYEPTVFVKFMNRHANNTCGNYAVPELSQNNTHIFTMQNVDISYGVFTRNVVLEKHTRKQTPMGQADSFKFLRKLKKIKHIEANLHEKIDPRPGGFTNPVIKINPETSKLFMGSGDSQYEIADLIINKDQYTLKTIYLEMENHYSLAGVLKNVRYLDASGKEKEGDLDLCFKATKERKVWLRETLK